MAQTAWLKYYVTLTRDYTIVFNDEKAVQCYHYCRCLHQLHDVRLSIENVNFTNFKNSGKS